MARIDVERALEELAGPSSRIELSRVIYRLVRLYSIHDLQRLYCHVVRELRYVPEPYRSRVLSKTLEQLFGTYRRMMAHAPPADHSLDKKSLTSFVEEVRMVLREQKDPDEVLLYFLLSAYRLFVEGIPGHPEGMPFPGGLQLRREGDVYYCPVRDKEDDVLGALCKYCIAKQG